MQDINNLLNSGEVPGMFGLEDKERLAASMRERVEAGGQVASKVRQVIDFSCTYSKRYIHNKALVSGLVSLCT